MTDIPYLIKRLREGIEPHVGIVEAEIVMDEAADEIERLRAKLAEYDRVLERCRTLIHHEPLRAAARALLPVIDEPLITANAVVNTPAHAHCPHGCEHPQPFLHKDEQVCGCCWFKHHVRTPMIPCTPELCDG